jgi:hypothetical protein
MRFLVIVGTLIAISSAQAQSEVVSAGYDIPEYQTVAAGQVLTFWRHCSRVLLKTICIVESSFGMTIDGSERAGKQGQ